jgi:hypothetical protein
MFWPCADPATRRSFHPSMPAASRSSIVTFMISTGQGGEFAGLSRVVGNRSIGKQGPEEQAADLGHGN